MARPVFLIIFPDETDGEALAADLRRRYDADYETVVEEPPNATIALLIVDERGPWNVASTRPWPSSWPPGRAPARGEGAIAIQNVHQHLG